MKTIEMRAHEFATQHTKQWDDEAWIIKNDSYKHGANDQRAIDYAKACNTFCKFHCGEKKGCMCEDLCKFSTLFTEGEE